MKPKIFYVSSTNLTLYNSNLKLSQQKNMLLFYIILGLIGNRHHSGRFNLVGKMNNNK